MVRGFMLLAIDVGNTNTVFGIYRGTELIKHFRIESVRGKTADEYGVLVASTKHGSVAWSMPTVSVSTTFSNQ